MIGKTISHYKILEKLGEGGMGVVYKAEDTKLKRNVALKFLPPELTRNPEVNQRFVHEAQAAAALEHTNICNIYEIDETEDGQTFIVMACYEGEILKDKIQKGPLNIEEALDIAVQITQGLDKAHDKGIIHRDIKPGNIIITEDNRVKIVDFGLATLSGQTLVAKTGLTSGTVVYMSPEQTMAEGANHRSDIWSLGVVLYEMVIGQLPFIGQCEQAVMYLIVNEDHKPIAELRTDVPRELNRIVNKALSKRPDNRYQDMKDMLDDLSKLKKEMDSGLSDEKIKKKSVPSIAVLPLVNISGDPEQDYFCDGLSEEIINGLTNLENLFVVARTSAFAFKNRNVKIRDIAKELNVENILEGSVRKAGNRLRIAATLIQVEDGSHLWSEKYDRNIEDVFEIQDEISLAIVDSLRVKLPGSEKVALVKRHTENLEAYNWYLKGRFFSEMMTLKGFEQAIECFELALKEDQNYAQVYTGLGLVFLLITLFGNVSPNDIVPKIRLSAGKALEIDDTIGEAHCLLAVCYMCYDWDWPLAEEEMNQALKLNPNSSMIHIYHSVFFTFTERHDEAIAAAGRARKLDPLSDFINYLFGQAYYIAGRFDESVKDLQNSLGMNPNYYPLHFTMGYNNRIKSKKREALEEFQKAYTLSGRVPWTEGLLCIELFENGNEEEAEELLEDLVRRSDYLSSQVLFD